MKGSGKMRNLKKVALFGLVVALLCGCAVSVGELADETVPLAGAGEDIRSISAPAAALSDDTDAPKIGAEEKAEDKADFGVEAAGTHVAENEYALIDYSNVSDGYVMVKYTAETEKRLKAQVKGSASTYTYNIVPGEWAVFPISEGDGSYTVTIYENAYDSKYASVLSCTCDVVLSDEFAPFLRPNQYVDYANAPETVAKAAELTAGLDDTLEMVTEVYDFTVESLVYDTERAATVKSGYLPVLDSVLAEKKGICFDYAALMTGMLRSQGVPCKLVVGYAGSEYHAWISVWTAEEGWVDGVIFFDGSIWHRMDPTFASGADSSESILDFIRNDSNYVEKYIY